MAKPEKTRGISRRHDNDAIFISYDEITRANYNPTNGYGNVNGAFFDTSALDSKGCYPSCESREIQPV